MSFQSIRHLIVGTFNRRDPFNKSMFVLVGIILPSICFAITFEAPPDGPTWQSGNLRDFTKLMLGGPAHRASYPLLLYSMLCMGLFVFRPKSTRLLAVRIGLYSAVPTACVYGWLLAISIIGLSEVSAVEAYASAAVYAAIATGSLLIVWSLLRLCWTALFRNKSTRFPSTIVLIVIVIGGLATGAFAVALLAALAAAPFWCLGVYAIASFSVMEERRHQRSFTLFHMGALLTLIAGHLATWRHTVDQALRIYSELPTEPPDQCFIATAAARGHPQLVGTRTEMHDACRINHQLVLLKSGEIAIKTLVPRVHRWLRSVYDKLGPMLAARITNRWLADAAYVLLKPFELSTLLALRCLDVNRELVRGVYAQSHETT